MMDYIISAVRTPAPGKTQMLLKTVVSDFEKNVGRGMVTFGNTGLIISHNPIENADVLEQIQDSFLEGNSVSESLAKQEADCSEPIRFLLREIIATIDPSKRSSNPKYIQRFMMRAKPGKAVDLLEGLLKNHEISNGNFNVSAMAENPGTLIMSKPVDHFNEIRKISDLKSFRDNFRNKGGADLSELVASMEGRIMRIAYMNRGT
tara:strand:+ start:1341 stop:1955 length:615 start_codon:yes stop_codon:yes gene_type:complete